MRKKEEEALDLSPVNVNTERSRWRIRSQQQNLRKNGQKNRNTKYGVLEARSREEGCAQRRGGILERGGGGERFIGICGCLKTSVHYSVYKDITHEFKNQNEINQNAHGHCFR